MLKLTETYLDYNGVNRTEDFFFNLTQTEVLELELGTVGGLSEMLTRIVQAKEISAIITVFKKIVLAAYGEKSEDGRRFMKSDEIRDRFSQTEAYSQIFMRLATDAEAASSFVNAIMPAKLTKETV